MNQLTFLSNFMVQSICLTQAMMFSLLYIHYSETSIHRFRWGSGKEAMDLGKQ
jgi:hypothetical protein